MYAGDAPAAFTGLAETVCRLVAVMLCVSADISLCFGGKASVEAIYEACERDGQWGIDTIALMSK